MQTTQTRYNSFKEFYPFYLNQHLNDVCRRLHFIGILTGILWMCIVLYTGLNPWYILGSILIGYAFGWTGHFFFEKNKPATLQYPFYSFAADFVMTKDILIGRVKF